MKLLLLPDSGKGKAGLNRFSRNHQDRNLEKLTKKWVMTLQQQKKMEESFFRAHREFISNLSYSLDLLEKDLKETTEMEQICTDEWCQATECIMDDLARMIYSISEPRWLTKEDSRKIKALRERVPDLYAQYKMVKA